MTRILDFGDGPKSQSRQGRDFAAGIIVLNESRPTGTEPFNKTTTDRQPDQQASGFSEEFRIEARAELVRLVTAVAHYGRRAAEVRFIGGLDVGPTGYAARRSTARRICRNPS